jgi:phosphate starvation-inducible PhoH-like protein
LNHINNGESNEENESILYGSKGNKILAKTVNQKKIVKLYSKNDLLFVVGPAGTGKTYVSVALGVRALKEKKVKKIIITRPVVEAGENLGFLPGDLQDKIDPYLKPIYDALEDMIPVSKMKKFIENKTIEIAPLAYMRGRTLKNAFILLDEAQNTTKSQLKMFLTRLGQNSKMIVTGDVSQIDLKKNQSSGLVDAQSKLNNIEGVGFTFLDSSDVLRHSLVKKILDKYQKS